MLPEQYAVNLSIEESLAPRNACSCEYLQTDPHCGDGLRVAYIYTSW
jgi:hypothetical protein